MYRVPFISVFLALLLTVSSCFYNTWSADSNRSEELSNARDTSTTVLANTNAQHPESTENVSNNYETNLTKASIIGKLPFIGCWSAGDTQHSVIVISKQTIQTRNSTKPLGYSLISSNEKDKTYILALKETDSSNELQRFITITLPQEDEIVLESYFTFEDIGTGPHGRARYFRDECKSIKAMLRHKKRAQPNR